MAFVVEGGRGSDEALDGMACLQMPNGRQHTSGCGVVLARGGRRREEGYDKWVPTVSERERGKDM